MGNVRAVILGCLFMTAICNARAGSFTEDHPFFGMIGNVTYDTSEQAYSYVHADGTLWVASCDGRTRAGTWRIDGRGNVCLIVGGVFEGCYAVRRDGNRFIHTETTGLNEGGMQFTMELRQEAPAFKLSDKQSQLLSLMSKAVGVIAVERGGDEKVYWHRDGLIHVVQPEGWIKVGSWWFDDKGNHCDNVNERTDCLSIETIHEDRVDFGWTVDGEKVLVKLNLTFND